MARKKREKMMMNQKYTTWCHFSFRRPKGKNYGLFSVAFYASKNTFNANTLLEYTTKRLKLWENHQHITAIQAYDNALYEIYRFQRDMLENDITEVFLVTDNSVLANWILSSFSGEKFNVNYRELMLEVNSKYFSLDAPRPIRSVSVGMGEVLPTEASYKFCKENRVNVSEDTGVLRDLTQNKIRLKEESVISIFDMAEEIEEGLEETTEEKTMKEETEMVEEGA